jgi:hypothetical protein
MLHLVTLAVLSGLDWASSAFDWLSNWSSGSFSGLRDPTPEERGCAGRSCASCCYSPCMPAPGASRPQRSLIRHRLAGPFGLALAPPVGCIRRSLVAFRGLSLPQQPASLCRTSAIALREDRHASLCCCVSCDRADCSRVRFRRYCGRGCRHCKSSIRRVLDRCGGHVLDERAESNLGAESSVSALAKPATHLSRCVASSP